MRITKMNKTREQWLHALEAVLGIETEDILEVCEMFFDGSADEVSAMRCAHSDGDYETLSRIAHGMKGSAANIGFDDVSEVAAGLELEAKEGSVADLDGNLDRLTAAVAAARAFTGL